jgi:hypothetical protein
MLPRLNEQPSEPDPLGERYLAFRPAPAYIAAGLIGGLLAMAAGGALSGFSLHGAYSEHWDLPFIERGGWSWCAVVIPTLVGLLFIYAGLEAVRFTCERMSFWGELRRHGFRMCSRGRREDISWTDVQSIQQVTSFHRLSVLHGLGSMIASKIATSSYKVILDSGKEYDFDRTIIKAFGEFRKVLRELAHQQAIRWETVEGHS